MKQVIRGSYSRRGVYSLLFLRFCSFFQGFFYLHRVPGVFGDDPAKAVVAQGGEAGGGKRGLSEGRSLLHRDHGVDKPQIYLFVAQVEILICPQALQSIPPAPHLVFDFRKDVGEQGDAPFQDALHIGDEDAVVGHGDPLVFGALLAVAHFPLVEHTAPAMDNQFIG